MGGDRREEERDKGREEERDEGGEEENKKKTIYES